MGFTNLLLDRLFVTRLHVHKTHENREIHMEVRAKVRPAEGR